MKRAVSSLISCALAVAALGSISIRHAVANTFLPCHDNSTWSGHTWTHGDPNTGLPGDPNGGNGYYYLSIKACGPIVEGTVYSPGDWDIDISPDFDHLNELAAAQFHGTGGRVFITNATAGQNYRLRVANISTHVQKDYAELNSGSPNDGQGDCGGPGPEIDPNTHGAPVDPAPTPGLPVMGCGPPGPAPPPPAPPPPTSVPPPAPAPGHTTPPQSSSTILTGRISPPAAPTTTTTAPPVALNPGNVLPRGPRPAIGVLPAIQADAKRSGGTTDYALIAAASGLVSIAIIGGLTALRRRDAG